MAKEGYDFDSYKNDAVSRPRDIAWSNWKKFEKVGDKVQGFIRDAFYRKADGLFQEQRGITIEQPNGELINVGIKRVSFVLPATDNFRLGDPLTIELIEEKPSATKGYNATKIFGFYGVNIPASEGNKTVKELEAEDMKAGGSVEPEEEEPTEATAEDIPFK